MQLYLLSSLSPSLFSLSFLPPTPPTSDGVWSWHVYKTGFYCYLNTSGRTRSSQPAEQDFSTVSCPLSEIAGNVNLIGFPFPGQWIRNAALSSWAVPSLHLPCPFSLSSFWVLIEQAKCLNTMGGHLSQENLGYVEASDLQGPTSGLLFKWLQFNDYSWGQVCPVWFCLCI